MVHVTERAVFKECRRAWQYSYRESLVPVMKPRDSRWFGIGGHKALAAYYRGEDPFKALESWYRQEVPPYLREMMSSEERRVVDEKINLLESIIVRYVTEFASQADDFDEIFSVEQPLKTRVPRTYSWLVGMPDLVVRRRGKLWVVDHKFLSSFVDEEDLYLDDQMTAYLWLVSQVYQERPGGALYNQLLKKSPVRSRIAQNELFRRVEVLRAPSELETFTNQLRLELSEMRNPKIYPSPTWRCIRGGGCDYRSLCRVENEGGNVDAVKEISFVKC